MLTALGRILGRAFSRRALAPPLIGLAATLAVGALAYTAPPALTDANLAVFDAYQRIKPRETSPDASPVRIVLIDEQSLERIGQWPWPRTEIARMVDRLTELGAASIAFDIVFSEPDRTSPARVAALWERRAPDLAAAITEADLQDNDAALSQAISQAPVALGAFLLPVQEAAPADADARRFPASVSIQGGDPRNGLTTFGDVRGGLPAFTEAAAGIGSVSLAERRGDVVRTVPMISRVGGGDALAPALSLEALRVAMGAPGYLLRATDASGEGGGGAPRAASIRVGDFHAPLTPDGAIWTRFAAQSPSAPPIPAWRLLADGPVPPRLADEVAGRIIFIGGAAAGLRDLVATPLNPQVPGVTVHAEIVEQIVAGDHISRPDWVVQLEAVAAIALGLIVSLVFAFRAPLLAAFITLLALGGVGALSWLGFDQQGLLIGPLFPVLGALAPAMSAGFASYALSDRERRAVRRQFEHFVPADVVAEISQDPDKFLAPSGETRELTLLFADIHGFSRLSEGLAPDELISLLNDVLTPISDAVLEEGGTIDKFMGDAMMAFWNAPRPTPDHPTRALRAALYIRAALRQLQADLAAQGRGPIDLGVGVNTGFCSVGSMGSRRRLDYSCIGDPVNVASRFEGLTRQYGVGICVGQTTAEAVDTGAFALLEIDRVRVKGRDTPETLYTLLGDASVAENPTFQDASDRFRGALEAYRAQRWQAARAGFEAAAALPKIGDIALDDLSRIFLSRVATLETAPPALNWDGVWTATEK